MSHKVIATPKAPAAIGPYSQAIQAGNTVYFSGQIPLNPDTMELATGFSAQTHQVFKNLSAVADAAGGDFKNFVKINIYLTDLSNFSIVNEIMMEYFTAPYPARAAVEVKGLPKGAEIEIEGIMVLA